MKPDFHINAFPSKPTDDKDNSRYLVISLVGEFANGKHHQLRTVRGWRCRYDLQKGTFDVPAEFAKNNAEALPSDPSK